MHLNIYLKLFTWKICIYFVPLKCTVSHIPLPWNCELSLKSCGTTTPPVCWFIKVTFVFVMVALLTNLFVTFWVLKTYVYVWKAKFWPVRNKRKVLSFSLRLGQRTENCVRFSIKMLRTISPWQHVSRSFASHKPLSKVL